MQNFNITIDDREDSITDVLEFIKENFAPDVDAFPDQLHQLLSLEPGASMTIGNSIITRCMQPLFPAFPNGFSSWMETYYEVVEHMTAQKEIPGTVEHETAATQGTGGLYELAEEWTNAFELQHRGREWNGEFFDELADFLNCKSNRLLQQIKLF